MKIVFSAKNLALFANKNIPNYYMFLNFSLVLDGKSRMRSSHVKLKQRISILLLISKYTVLIYMIDMYIFDLEKNVNPPSSPDKLDIYLF